MTRRTTLPPYINARNDNVRNLARCIIFIESKIESTTVENFSKCQSNCYVHHGIDVATGGQDIQLFGRLTRIVERGQNCACGAWRKLCLSDELLRPVARLYYPVAPKPQQTRLRGRFAGVEAPSPYHEEFYGEAPTHGPIVPEASEVSHSRRGRKEPSASASTSLPTPPSTQTSNNAARKRKHNSPTNPVDVVRKRSRLLDVLDRSTSATSARQDTLTSRGNRFQVASPTTPSQLTTEQLVQACQDIRHMIDKDQDLPDRLLGAFISLRQKFVEKQEGAYQ